MTPESSAIGRPSGEPVLVSPQAPLPMVAPAGAKPGHNPASAHQNDHRFTAHLLVCRFCADTTPTATTQSRQLSSTRFGPRQQPRRRAPLVVCLLEGYTG